MGKQFIFLFLFTLLLNSILMGQEGQQRVTGKFDAASLPDFFRQLEKKGSFIFYYKESQLDPVAVHLTVDNMRLSDVLQKALEGSGLFFAVSGNRVFITKGTQIATSLPEDFFGSKNSTERNQPTNLITDTLLTTVKRAKATESKLISFGMKSGKKNPENNIITGYVRNARTGEPVLNASVYADSLHATTTDAYGHYSLSIPSGNSQLSIQVIGMKDIRLQLAVYADGNLDIEMDEEVRTLKEVIVSGRKTSNIRNVQMGVERLTIDNIRNIPTVFGEADVLRVIVSLPGVKTVGEASTGFNVRGGSVDQNLVLYNDATIYNPSHFFGLFSAFNPEVIKDIELYKSSIPAKYGGRLASVLEITSREGNKKRISGSAGIGLVTSRVHLEGPIEKDRSSFIFGGRTTYANWLLKLLPDEYKNSRASFQDINFSTSHKIDSNNNLYFTGYFSNDRFSLDGDTTYGYSNRNVNLKWKHNFSNRLVGIFITGYDQYAYTVDADRNKVNAFKLGFDIAQLNFKANFDYFINSKHSFDFGLSSIRYQLHPGYIEPNAASSVVQRDEIRTEQALESGLFLTHKFNANAKLSFSSGIRLSVFNYLGPNAINLYPPGQPITESNRVETKQYGKGKFIKTYLGPEFRFSARYAFSGTFSMKAAYNSLRQYIHLLSNTTIVAPTDIWKLSDPNIKPQRGEQFSVGLYKNFKSNTIETSIEFYYKKIHDYLDYKPGATLFLNHHVETEVINTRGKAYGLEILIKKPGGKLNGWISYTYSRILLQANDPTQGAVVNNGDFYPANYDKPNDITITGNFKVNHRFSFSLNSTYSTGRPITVPVGRYFYAGAERVLYSDRNAYRIPDYFRSDFSMNIEGNHKVNQKTHNSWTLGVYNMFGRRNPYSVYFVTENGLINGYKISIFGNVIPFINYNIRF
ncbi:MAG: TonB-dependent receptor plug domain-containing protein [Terrimonas sp.]|nr:TonB-dependent receptor plug domain-containing protein [Terrimonas sp.]